MPSGHNATLGRKNNRNCVIWWKTCINCQSVLLLLVTWRKVNFSVGPWCSQGATLLLVTLRCRPVVCLSIRGRTPTRTFTFYAFLDVLCHPECSKNFSLQFFFTQFISGEVRRDTMLPSISSSPRRVGKPLRNEKKLFKIPTICSWLFFFAGRKGCLSLSLSLSFSLVWLSLRSRTHSPLGNVIYGQLRQF